ncbi:hypothetical protein [Lentilitoribacter sp. EG35]|uniref:hypothetical protein n=1 Tax=Lentilitoribacter sp. EG35 TaxID=3234192 RepID=UPI0034617100
MTEEVNLRTISKPKSSLLDVVFVHGLTGDATKTWTSKSGFWPEWLAEGNQMVGVYTLGFPASKFKKSVNRELDIYELAKPSTELLCGNGIGQRPVMFVTHNFGGILTKLILQHCNGSLDNAHACPVSPIRIHKLAHTLFSLFSACPLQKLV